MKLAGVVVASATADKKNASRRLRPLTCAVSAGLMGDFRTGWITLTSPRSMFVAQVVGSLVRSCTLCI